MNHCLLEVEVLDEPKVRYAPDNQLPIAEMTVRFEGLRPEDPPSQLRVVGFGNLAQDLQNRVQVGQRLVVEGRLRMNSITRPDGTREKKLEFTLARLHPLDGSAPAAAPMAPAASPAAPRTAAPAKAAPRKAPAEPAPTWNAAPLVDLPDDEIPF
ncbi:MAG: single-stranded DNA-binding protein [Cyanobacteriota bacterium]